MSPLPLLIGAAALAGAGGLLGQKDAAKRAQAVAAARNAVLRDSLARTDVNAADNRGLFDGAVGGIGGHAPALAGAQDARAEGNVANISAVNPNAIQLSDSAPAAVRSEISKRMLSAFQGATERARASGRLGGYNDAWLGHKIDIGNTTSGINTNNNFARGQMTILPGMQDLAEQGAYKPPALFPQLLQFAGNVLGSAAGKGMFGASGGPMMAPSPNGGSLAPMFPR